MYSFFLAGQKVRQITERCRMARLRGIKSRVQFSDNPVTIVQQKKKLIFCCFFKNRRPLHPYTDFSYCLLQEKYKTEFQQDSKVVSKIPYALQKYCKIYLTPFLLPFPYPILLPQPDCFRRQFRKNFPDAFISSLIYF